MGNEIPQLEQLNSTLCQRGFLLPVMFSERHFPRQTKLQKKRLLRFSLCAVRMTGLPQ
jgi:hypothetical protein